MRISIEAEPEELAKKSAQLVEAIHDLLEKADPDIAEALEKALPRKEQEIKFPALRDLQDQMTKIYEHYMDLMIGEIVDTLHANVSKAEGYDISAPIIKREEVAYRRAKEVLIQLGWAPGDFDEGGPLYGLSTNQLLDLARERRAG